jgi:dCTP deaminase
MGKKMSGNEQANGILPVQQLQQAIEAGMISAANEIESSQIQPASLDLRLGEDAWRVQASFLPGRGMSVTDKLEKFAMHRIDLSDGAVLERGCVYIVRLQESLRLPAALSAMANPKSSTGRV